MSLNRLQQIEAARYVVQRRLAPALRHGIVGKLHPVGLVAEALARRMQARPDAAAVGEGILKLHELAQGAMAGCTDLLGWLSPDLSEPVEIGAGIAQCVSLLETDLGLSGHVLRTTGALELRTDLLTLRQVLPAVLLSVQAELAAPSDLLLEVRPGRESAQESALQIGLSVTPADRTAMGAPEQAYRAPSWAEACLLAEDAGATLARIGDRIEIGLPAA